MFSALFKRKIEGAKIYYLSSVSSDLFIYRWIFMQWSDSYSVKDKEIAVYVDKTRGKLKTKSNKIISLLLSSKDLISQPQINRKIGNYRPLNYFYPLIFSLILLLIKAKSLPKKFMLETKWDIGLSFRKTGKSTLFMLIRTTTQYRWR